MRTLSLSILALTLTASASAQIVGGVTGAVGGAVTAPGNMPSPAATLDSATAARHVRTPEVNVPTVAVRAGVSTRVDRGTRCYYANDYYDPAYRDGTYYCETRSSGAGAAAGVSTQPPQQ